MVEQSGKEWQSVEKSRKNPLFTTLTLDKTQIPPIIHIDLSKIF
jgi:hypothetical protein